MWTYAYILSLGSITLVKEWLVVMLQAESRSPPGIRFTNDSPRAVNTVHLTSLSAQMSFVNRPVLVRWLKWHMDFSKEKVNREINKCFTGIKIECMIDTEGTIPTVFKKYVNIQNITYKYWLWTSWTEKQLKHLRSIIEWFLNCTQHTIAQYQPCSVGTIKWILIHHFLDVLRHKGGAEYLPISPFEASNRNTLCTKWKNSYHIWAGLVATTPFREMQQRNIINKFYSIKYEKKIKVWANRVNQWKIILDMYKGLTKSVLILIIFSLSCFIVSYILYWE